MRRADAWRAGLRKRASFSRVCRVVSEDQLMKPKCDTGPDLNRVNVVTSDSEREPGSTDERMSDSNGSEDLIARRLGHRCRARSGRHPFTSARGGGSEDLSVKNRGLRKGEFSGERAHDAILECLAFRGPHDCVAGVEMRIESTEQLAGNHVGGMIGFAGPDQSVPRRRNFFFGGESD